MKALNYSSELPHVENSMWVIGIIAVAGAVVSAVGTYQQGQAQKAMAEANANLADQEAKQKLAVSNMQEMLAQQQAEVDKRIALSEADAAKNNAAAKDQEALALESQQRENNKRKQLEIAKRKAFTKSLFASSGIVGSTGTPLALMVEQDTTMQLEQMDNFYETAISTQKLRFEGNVFRREASQKGYAANAQNTIAKNASTIRSLAARMSYRATLQQGQINRWYGGEQASIATTAAIGQGLSGIASAGAGIAK